MADRTDLFGQEPVQGSLFGGGEDRLPAPVVSSLPDPEQVRQRLQGLLEKVRGATVLPWPERDARMWQTVFPNMAKWLLPEEAEQLCFAFTQELRRLKAA